MGTLTVLALRVVLAVLLAGSVFIQSVLVVLLATGRTDLGADFEPLRIPIVIIIVLGIATGQIVLVCVWKLATMVRRGNLFSPSAFRYVDVAIGAIVAAALLVFALAGVLASANHRVPDDAVAPGLILLMGGVGLAALGVALVVLVMRMLLAQAIARDHEAAEMQAELKDVI